MKLVALHLKEQTCSSTKKTITKIPQNADGFLEITERLTNRYTEIPYYALCRKLFIAN